MLEECGMFCNGPVMKNYEHQLTEREIAVLKLLMKGYSHKIIADKLKISIDTVRTHMRHLHSKSGTNSGPELIRWGYEHGFEP